jgi:hypothetical protein
MSTQPDRASKLTLAGTIDQVAEANFLGRKIPAVQRRSAARLIAGRLGLPGGYAGAFAETAAERSRTVRVFTGENLGRNARRRHVLAEETCRSLRLLGRTTAHASAALQAADNRLLAQIAQVRARHPDTPHGTFCCPFCTVSVWRHATVGGLRPVGRHLGDAFWCQTLPSSRSRPDQGPALHRSKASPHGCTLSKRHSPLAGGCSR